MHRTVRAISLLALAACGLALSASQAGKPVLLRTQPRVHEIRLEVELFQQAPTDIDTGARPM